MSSPTPTPASSPDPSTRHEPAALDPAELAAEQAVNLPAREAMSLIAPGGAEGAAHALETVPDGSAAEGAIGDNAPIYTIQPIRETT